MHETYIWTLLYVIDGDNSTGKMSISLIPQLPNPLSGF